MAKNKSPDVRQLINEAVGILETFGVPLSAATPRKREMAGMCFLAVVGVTHSADWPSAATHPGAAPTSRQIIDFLNKHFEEKISKGSYDDIRRKHLKGATDAGIVLKSASTPGAAPNDPRRGYGLNPDFGPVVRSFGQKGWAAAAAKFMEGREPLADLTAKKAVAAMPLILPDGTELKLGPGKHNALQRAVVEQFRPRFAPGSRVLYLGDAEQRMLLADHAKLKEIALPIDAAGSLPDIVLLDEKKGWIFLIEAVHSFGPISPARMLTLKSLCASCNLPLVFVTAFLDRATFRTFAPEIAWETEVWIAQEPDHMIHFNGDRFIGPRCES